MTEIHKMEMDVQMIVNYKMDINVQHLDKLVLVVINIMI